MKMSKQSDKRAGLKSASVGVVARNLRVDKRMPFSNDVRSIHEMHCESNAATGWSSLRARAERALRIRLHTLPYQRYTTQARVMGEVTIVNVSMQIPQKKRSRKQGMNAGSKAQIHPSQNVHLAVRKHVELSTKERKAERRRLRVGGRIWWRI
jgi:hypothetical protein